MLVGADFAILAIFIIITLFVGIVFSRGINSVKKYALGDCAFSTSTLAATLTATWIGGGFFSVTISNTYLDGVNYMILGVCEVIAFVVIASIIAPRIGPFIGDLSIAESLGKRYGSCARVITAFFGIARVVGTIAIQFKVCASIFSYFFGVNHILATWVASFMVILYSAFGGIKAVTLTDVVQFITFIIFIPLLSLAIWGTIDNPEIVFATVKSNPILNTESFFAMSSVDALDFAALTLLFIMPGLDPAIFQRLIIAKDAMQAKLSVNIAAASFLFILLLTFWVAILLLSNNNNLVEGEVLGYIIDNFTYDGLRGLLLVGVMAMLMSTADSYINSASVLFAHDFCVPLNIKWAKNNELLLTKLSALMLGSGALLIAINAKNLFEIIVTMASFYMPIVTVPIFLTILGFISSKRTYIAGVSTGIFLTIFGKIVELPMPGTVYTVIAILMVAVVMFSFHYFMKQEGGWQQVPVLANKQGQSWEDCFDSFNTKNLSYLFISSRPTLERSFTIMGLFFVVSAFSTMYSIPYEIRSNYHELVLFIYNSVLSISAAFITYPIWPERVKSQVLSTILWLGGLTYVLIFIGSTQVLMNNLGQFQLMTLLLGIVILATVLRWQLALAIIIFGVLSSIQFFKLYTGIDLITGEFASVQFKIMYLLLMVTSIGVAFLKPKQEHLDATEAALKDLETEVTHLDYKVQHYSKRVSDQAKEIERLGATAQKILNNVNHELRLPVGNVLNFSEMLYEGLEKHSPEQLKELTDEVYKSSTRLSSMILNMLDLANLDVQKVNLQKTRVNFSELVEDRVKTCRNVYLQGKKISFTLVIEREVIIAIDPNYIRQVVDNLIINAINFSQNGTIKVKVERASEGIVFIIQDEGVGIPDKDIYDIFSPFKMGSNTESKADGRGVGLALCKSVIEAHDGVISAQSLGVKGAMLKFVLPSE